LQLLFGAYVEAKQRQNVLDYDDLLLYWRRWSPTPDLAAEISGNVDHVLVDEYQDTSRLQSTILLGLRPDGAGRTVVGDDAQSIYAFRGATVRNILDYPASSRNNGSLKPLCEAVKFTTRPQFRDQKLTAHLAGERSGRDSGPAGHHF
jgi:DNA helicase II / ATP-dependent DNA helicase PcrA